MKLQCGHVEHGRQVLVIAFTCCIFVLFFRCIYYAVVFNAKYQITSKIRSFFFTIFEIFHLVTGFNVTNFFQRRSSKLESDNEDEAIDFPTSSSEAVRHLLQQRENKPYRWFKNQCFCFVGKAVIFPGNKILYVFCNFLVFFLPKLKTRFTQCFQNLKW